MLELDDSGREGELVLTKDVLGDPEASLVAVHPRAEALCLGFEKRGAPFRGCLLHEGDQLRRLADVAQRQRRLDCDDDRLLGRLLRVPERARRLDSGLCVRERLSGASLGTGQSRARTEIRGAILDVFRILEVPEEGEDAASLVQLSTLDMDLDRALEQAEQHAA